MQLESKNTRKNHILEMLIPFFGVLAPYRIGIIPTSAILLLVIVLFRNGGKVRIPKLATAYVAFVAYLVVRDILHMFFSVSDPIDVQINRLLEKVILYALILLVCEGDFDEDALFKWWKVAGVIYGAGMLYHVVQLVVLGEEIHPISIIPGYDIAHEDVESFSRPTSFFPEPAAYVGAMLPLLFLSLRKRNFLWAAVSAFLIVVSTSTVGIILTAVMWMVFILMEKNSIKTKLLYIAFAVLFTVLFLNLAIFSDALEKLQDVSEGESTWRSRVEGPIQMIKALNWKELPFGTNLVDTASFVRKNISHFPADSIPYIYVTEKGLTVFLNTYCNLIFRYGIVGLILFLKMFKGKILNKKYAARIYAITMLVAAIAQSTVASPAVPLMMLLLYTNKSAEKGSI